MNTGKVDEAGNPIMDMTPEQVAEANANLARKKAEEAILQQELQSKVDASKSAEQIAEELKKLGIDPGLAKR